MRARLGLRSSARRIVSLPRAPPPGPQRAAKVATACLALFSAPLPALRAGFAAPRALGPAPRRTPPRRLPQERTASPACHTRRGQSGAESGGCPSGLAWLPFPSPFVFSLHGLKRKRFFPSLCLALGPPACVRGAAEWRFATAGEHARAVHFFSTEKFPGASRAGERRPGGTGREPVGIRSAGAPGGARGSQALLALLAQSGSSGEHTSKRSAASQTC